MVVMIVDCGIGRREMLAKQEGGVQTDIHGAGNRNMHPPHNAETKQTESETERKKENENENETARKICISVRGLGIQGCILYFGNYLRYPTQAQPPGSLQACWQSHRVQSGCSCRRCTRW